MYFQCGINPQNCPFPLGLRYPAGGGSRHGHRQHARTMWERSRVWFGRYAHGQTDRHTDTRTQTCSLQYFATAAAGEVIKIGLIVIPVIWTDANHVTKHIAYNKTSIRSTIDAMPASAVCAVAVRPSVRLKSKFYLYLFFTVLSIQFWCIGDYEIEFSSYLQFLHLFDNTVCYSLRTLPQT